MESQALATISPQRSKPCESPSKKQLIRLWIGKFALNAGQALQPVDLGVTEALWLEGFDDLSYDMLEAAFKKALKVCKFWPVKIADIREHVSSVESSSTKEAAERAWEMVLGIRLKHWCPDAPGGFYGGKPQLSPRVEQACRASGVFRDVETVNDLHVWTKRRFIESFLAYDESEAGKYLLPDGEIKDILAGCAEMKMLPWRKPEQNENLPTAEERLRIADELSAAARRVLGIRDKMKFEVKDTAERREELRQQAELIKRRYPAEVRA